MGSQRYSLSSAPQGLYETSTSQLAPMGSTLLLNDGREFVYCEVGAVAAVAGRFYQSPVPEAADFVAMALDTPAAGTKVVNITPTGTATLAENEAAEGYLVLSTGELYKIAGHPAVAAATAANITLADGLVEAVAGATTGSIIKNPHRDLIIAVATTPTARVMGVPIRDHAADAFGWFQRRGPASCLTQGTVVISDPVGPGTDAGSCAPLAAGTAETFPHYGHCVLVGATTTQSIVWLDL